MPGFFEKFIFELETIYLSIYQNGPEIGDYLGCNVQKHGVQTVLQNYLHDEDKGVREGSFFLIFRLANVLHDSYQGNEIVMEIEECKQKVPDDYVKSFSRVLLSVLETSVVS